MRSGAGAEPPRVRAGLLGALLALGPEVHDDRVLSGLEPDEVLVGAGPEAHHGERHDAPQLVFRDLGPVEHEHPGEVVAQVGRDGVLEPGEIPRTRRHRVDRARERAAFGLGVGLGEQQDTEVQHHEHDPAHEDPPPGVAEQGRGHRREGTGARCCHGIGPCAP